MATWTRFETSSLVSRRETWAFTVASLMNREAAISAFDAPDATSRARGGLNLALYYLDRGFAPAGKTRAFQKARDIVDALAPGASHAQALAAARWPDSREPVLLVGHQPALGQLAAWLMGGPQTLDGAPWAVRKGAVWWLRQRDRGGVPEVVLVSVRTPDRL